MQLSLNAVSKIKDTSAEALGLLKCVEADGVMEMRSELQDLFVKASGTIEVISSFTDIQKSLETVGYSDKWYEMVFESSNLKDLCEIDMPKFLDNPVNRGKACMEGIMDTIKTWCKKALEVIMKIIDGIIKFMDWLNKQARVHLKNNKEFKRKSFSLLDVAAKKLAERALGITIEDYYDFEKLGPMVMFTRTLIDVLCPSNKNGVNEANPAIFNADGIQNMSNDQLKHEFFNRLAKELQLKGIQYNNMDNGFVLKFDGAINKYVKFFDDDAPGEFPKLTINIAQIKDAADLISKATDSYGVFIDSTLSLITDVEAHVKHRKSEFEKILRNIDYTGDANDPSTDTVNKTKANIILSMCGLSIITGASQFINRIFNAFRANQQMQAELVKAIYGAANNP